MRPFSDFITEDFKNALKQHSRQAAHKAKSLGLEYYGFGRYGQKGSHKVEYVVKNNILVKVAPKQQKPLDYNDIDNQYIFHGKWTYKYNGWNEIFNAMKADKNINTPAGQKDVEFAITRLNKEIYTTKKSNIDYWKEHIDKAEKQLKKPYLPPSDKEYYTNQVKEYKDAIDDTTKVINDFKEHITKFETLLKKPETSTAEPLILKKRGRPKTRLAHYEARKEISHEEANKLTLDYHSRIWGEHEKKQTETYETLTKAYDKSKFTKEELRVISDYTAADSKEMILHAVSKFENPKEHEEVRKNGHEWEKSELERKDRKNKIFDEAIEAVPLPCDVTTFSGLKHPFQNAENFKKGKKVYFSGYLSTSLSENTAIAFSHKMNNISQEHKTNMVVQISAKKGQSALWVDHISSNLGEKELIFPRDTVFKVVGEPKVLLGKSDFDEDVTIIQLEVDEQR